MYHWRRRPNRESWIEQLVTSGHCGYEGSNNWYHQGFGFIGSETNTQYYGGGIDIMSVQMPDSQDSSLVYGRTQQITAVWLPYDGEGVCSARGVSATSWTCGVVQDWSTSWTGDRCNCTLYGADSTLSFIVGDSGSPIVDSVSQNRAVGIAATAQGHFAILTDALLTWGYSLRTP